MKMRVYIEKVKLFNPVLEQTEREKVENELKDQKTVPRDSFDLKAVMRVAKLNAQSEGRSQITHKDYMASRELIYEEFLNKKE